MWTLIILFAITVDGSGYGTIAAGASVTTIDGFKSIGLCEEAAKALHKSSGTEYHLKGICVEKGI